MKKNIAYRILMDAVILYSILQGWWIVTVPLGLIAAWNFPYFFEIIVAGIAYDSLFGVVPEMGIRGYMGTIVSIVIVVGIAGLKKILRK